jgi:hypothetical protein
MFDREWFRLQCTEFTVMNTDKNRRHLIKSIFFFLRRLGNDSRCEQVPARYFWELDTRLLGMLKLGKWPKFDESSEKFKSILETRSNFIQLHCCSDHQDAVRICIPFNCVVPAHS